MRRDACREMAAMSLAGSDASLAIETARKITNEAMRQKIFGMVRQGLSWNPAALADLQTRFPGSEWSASQMPKK